MASMARNLSRGSTSISLHRRVSILCFSSASQGKEHLNNGYGFTDSGDAGVRTQATKVTREGTGKMSELGSKAAEKAEEGSQKAADKAASFGDTVVDAPGKAWEAAKDTAQKMEETVAGGTGKVWEAAKGTAQKVKETVVGKSEVDDKPIEDYIEDHVGKPVKKEAVDDDVDLKDGKGAFDRK